MTRRREQRRSSVSEQPEPLGSVSRPFGPLVPGTQTCLACGSADLVRIRMGAPGGRDVVFVSCRACEHTGWFDADGDGTPLTSDEVANLQTPGGRRPGR